LHEFLPHGEADIAEVAAAAGVSVATLNRRIGELHEFNPMLGPRGCRLVITYPEIYEMLATAPKSTTLVISPSTVWSMQ
ncbi:MAG: hypothetical protein H7175_19730, partial [Burkholderiales bacterium]|nr:hypothetical protein [Anaerolineae bacterium]